MECAACSEHLPDGAAFCHRCGSRQAATACAQCRAELLPNAAFCSACGTPTASTPGPGAERRLTSVLFADLVGYTTLSEARDTEDVRELLSSYFDTCSTVVRRYGGTVEKFIGDAVMAVWGVPTAHEDDAERAVRAGLELVTEVAALGERLGVPELALRVGVVSGEVAATIGATNQGMVAGDPVNTAARIQSLAPAGQVWVDAQTRSLTSAAVTYVDVGDHALKGKAEPVRLYRAGTVVAAVGGLQRVDGLEAPLVGRDRELRLLKELFHATEESRRPQLVVLDGEAGVGKTRLGWEFEKYVDGLTTRVAWHRGRCLSYGEGVAFWALAEAVRGRVGLVESESGAVVLDGLDQLLDRFVPDAQERDWVRPRVASLLGEEDREFARDDLFAAWTRFLERVAGDDPLVLLIDDAQYADDGLLDFLEFLLANGRVGCFVLLLARPELLSARPELGGRRATPIRIEPLPRTAMGDLVDGLVAGLPDDVRAGLVQRAEGIPLFAVETVRALIDRDIVVPREGRYIVSPGQQVDLSSIGAPASLHALVAARLDGLGATERRVLTDASVLGASFTREGIAILASDVDALDGVLAALARRELISTEVDRFSAERGQYRFVQSVVRQVAYGTLSRRDRKSRHLLVAEHLGADADRADDLSQVIAQHLLDAAEAAGSDDPDHVDLRHRAGELLVRAADRARALGSYVDAARSLDLALTCFDDLARRAQVLLTKAAAALRFGRLDDAAEASAAAIEGFVAVGDVVRAGEAAFYSSRSTLLLGRGEEALSIAVEWYDRLAAAGVDHPDGPRVRGRLALARATALMPLGRSSESHEPLAEALEIADFVDDPELFRIGISTLARLQAHLGSQRVASLLWAGLADIAGANEDWFAQTGAMLNVAVIRARYDVAEALALTLDGVRVAHEHGMTPDPVVHVNILNYSWLTGQWDQALGWMATTRERASNYALPDAYAAATSALCRWAGRPAEDPPDTGDMTALEDEMAAGYLQGARYLEAGDEAAALVHLRAAVQSELRVSGTYDDLHLYWPLAVRTAVRADSEAATELLALVDLARMPQTASLAGHARVFRAIVTAREHGGTDAEVEDDFLAGIATLDRCGATVWRAHAQEDYGTWLLGRGRTDEAKPHLVAAREAFEAMGATAWVARVDRVAMVSQGTAS